MSAKIVPLVGLSALIALGGGVAADVPGLLPASSATAQTTSVEHNADFASRCAALAGSPLAGATIDRAEVLAVGTVLQPTVRKLTTAVCRLDASISPAPGSKIKIQIWLPHTWNRKFVGIGGGGFNGGLATGAAGLGNMANKGYAGVATNAGHDPEPQAKWAMGSPEKIVDFAHRGNHLGAVVGKAAVEAFYGSAATRSYFEGCSNGGRDALMLAQRHPDDYDAIVAGAPANDWVGLMSWFAHADQVARVSPGPDLLGPKLKFVHEAAMNACDARDGLRDRLVERPSHCSFDPAVLQCKSENGSGCLSKAEVGAIRALYGGVPASHGSSELPGLSVGSEYQWQSWVTASNAAGGDFARQFFRYMVYDDPAWETSRFTLRRDYPYARSKLGRVLDAVDPDLQPFLRRGGKLLMYHGWDDAAIPAQRSVRYYRQVLSKIGATHANQVRLFMLPGVAHCRGGNGPDAVDWLGAIDAWSDSGRAPDQLTATKYDNLLFDLIGRPTKIVSTRPICAMPKTAHYAGAGSVKVAASYVCR